MAYRNYSTANGFIVDKSGNGDFTTISSALTAAPSGSVIFIRPGTYTESPTISTNVTMIGAVGDANIPNVILNGLLTINRNVSTVSVVSNIQFQNSSGGLITALLGLAGINATCTLTNCYFISTSNGSVALTLQSNSATLIMTLRNCIGYNTATGATILDTYGFGVSITNVYNCQFNSTVDTLFNCVNAQQYIYNSTFNRAVFNCQGNTTIELFNSTIKGNAAGTASCMYFSNNGATTANFYSYRCNYIGNSNTIPCVSLQALSSANSTFHSFCDNFITSYTYAITVYSFGSTLAELIYFGATTNAILFNKTNLTVIPHLVDGGFYAGNQFSNTTTGCLGQQIRSYIASGSAITLTNNTPANVTSISLTAGIWDVSAIGAFSGTITGTQTTVSISSTSATLNTNTGDATVSSPNVPLVSSDLSLEIPTFRVAISATTTYYLVVNELFSAGTATAYGRISAVRTG